MAPSSLRARMLLAFLLVAAASLGTIGIAVLLVGPGYFAEAMGHGPNDPAGVAMDEATRAAFADAMRRALLAASVIAIASATVVSLAVAKWTVGLINSFLPMDAAGGFTFRMDMSMLLFAAVLSLGTGFVFGLFPALHSTRADLLSTLKGQSG